MFCGKMIIYFGIWARTRTRCGGQELDRTGELKCDCDLCACLTALLMVYLVTERGCINKSGAGGRSSTERKLNGAAALRLGWSCSGC